MLSDVFHIFSAVKELLKVKKVTVGYLCTYILCGCIEVLMLWFIGTRYDPDYIVCIVCRWFYINLVMRYCNVLCVECEFEPNTSTEDCEINTRHVFTPNHRTQWHEFSSFSTRILSPTAHIKPNFRLNVVELVFTVLSTWYPAYTFFLKISFLLWGKQAGRFGRKKSLVKSIGWCSK